LQLFGGLLPPFPGSPFCLRGRPRIIAQNPEYKNVREEIVPVLIVGGGPVGLALAGDLGWRGVPCVPIPPPD